jgi:hypothetical protein
LQNGGCARIDTIRIVTPQKLSSHLPKSAKILKPVRFMLRFGSILAILAINPNSAHYKIFELTAS